MKHLIISILAGLVLFTYVKASTTPQPIQDVKDIPIARTFGVQAVAQISEEIEEETEQKVGLLFYKGDNLSSTRLKRTLEKQLNLGENFNTIYSSNNIETQMNMFDKMIEQNYKVIIIELGQENDAEYFIRNAEKNNVGLIFIGEEPDKRLLQSYDRAYYLGYNDAHFENAVAYEISLLYNEHLEDIDVVHDDEIIKYATVFSNENAEQICEDLQNSLDFYEIPTENPVNSQVKKVNYDLFDEIDQTIIKKCELIIFDNSVELKRTLDYFHDPEEFKHLPKQKIIIMQYDDNTDDLLNDESVIMAIGFDDAILADTAARLTMALAMDITPSYETIGIEPIDDKSFYINYSVATKL